MSTPTLQEYAILSAVVYTDARGRINATPLPPSWIPATSPATATTPNGTPYYTSDITNGALTNGLSAEAYRNGNDIVIAFKGTDFLLGTNNGQTIADLLSDLSLGTGGGSEQLLGAAMFYAKIKAENPTANITFTGHSLGAGLASIMSVWFNESANIFADAPFYLSSINGDFAKRVLDSLQAKGYVAPQLASLIQTIDNGYGNPLTYTVPSSGISARESNVTSHFVRGEVLNALFGDFSMIVGAGQNTPIEIGGGDKVSAVTLHSIVLHAALLLEDKLRTDTLKLPDLVSMIFDEKLFANKLESQNAQDFLSKLLNDQIPLMGGSDTATGELTRFATDLKKLIQDGGLTLKDYQLTGAPNSLSKALTAFAMQKYYEETQTSTSYKKELFTDISTEGGSNGIRFAMTDVSTRLETEYANREKGMELNQKVDGKFTLKGYQYFQQYLTENKAPDLGAGTVNFTAAEQQLITTMLPVLRDWYVQAGASGMIATDTLNRGAFMLGGNAQDTLTGGSKADLLVGNAGDDILKGGDGSDVLIGGTGVDTYAWNASANSGIDTILDSDKQGYLRDDPSTGSGQAGAIVLTGGTQYGDNRVFSGKDANGTNHIYTFVTGDRNRGGDLIVDGAMLIKDYNPSAGNHMGITLDDACIRATNDSAWRVAA